MDYLAHTAAHRLAEMFYPQQAVVNESSGRAQSQQPLSSEEGKPATASGPPSMKIPPRGATLPAPH